MDWRPDNTRILGENLRFVFVLKGNEIIEQLDYLENTTISL